MVPHPGFVQSGIITEAFRHCNQNPSHKSHLGNEHLWLRSWCAAFLFEFLSGQKLFCDLKMWLTHSMKFRRFAVANPRRFSIFPALESTTVPQRY